jgi:hypothetical protein
VKDDEVKGGRWVNYESFVGANARFKPTTSVAAAAKAPAAKAASKPEPMETETVPSPKKGSKKGKSRDED